MTFVHLLNYLTIIVIMLIIFYLSDFVSRSKYSLVKALLMFVLCFDFWYFKWFYRNSIYFWCNILIILLICTNLTLITQFSANNIFQKPLFVFMVSPLQWGAILAVMVIALGKYKSFK